MIQANDLFCSHPILLGSGITILSLGIGAFTQQAIKSVSCHLPMADMTASVPVIHSIFGSDTIVSGATEFALDYGTKGAVINGISNPGKDTSKVKLRLSGVSLRAPNSEAHERGTNDILGERDMNRSV